MSAPSQAELARAARLLGLARSGARRPVDLLLEDLEAHADPLRFESLLASGPAGVDRGLRDGLAEGGVELAALEELKERCKVGRAGDLRSHLGRLAGYYVAVAAALAHHRARISAASMEKVAPVLLDLSLVTPSPWCELFARAARGE